MYTISLHRRVKKFLSKIPRKEAHAIIQKIEFLSINPFSDTLDIKKLATSEPAYRLRVGKIRIVYEVNTYLQRIYIDDIDFRGNIY